MSHSPRHVPPGRSLAENGSPELLAQWHPTKNGDLTPQTVSAGSNLKAWWLCEHEHEWQAAVGSRVRTSAGCSVCNNKKVVTGINDLATTHPALALEFHPTKNLPLTAESVNAGRNKKVWWQCSVDASHEWQASPVSRSRLNSGCPFCSGRNRVEGQNDLATTHPDVAALWHPTLNVDLTPADVSAQSHKKVWWTGCERNEEHYWESTVDSLVRSRSKGLTGCAVCAGQQVLPGVNDLASQHPAVAAQWHPEKNGALRPEDVPAGSDRQVWWRCEAGHEWRCAMNNRTIARHPTGCRQCSTVGVSKQETLLADWLESEGVRVLRSVRDVIPPQELDIYLPEYRFAIEFNGLYWHSEAAGKGRDYHANKVRLAQEAGITLFQVWEDDWRDRGEIVKHMILHRIGRSQERTIYARASRVEMLSSAEANVFLNAHHIQGGLTNARHFGLVHQGEIVAVMSIRRGGKDDTVYLDRYATSCRVPGGFTKLLKSVRSATQAAQIVTFADRSVSEGALYENNGFRVDKVLPPDYAYLVKGQRVHKFNYRLKRFRDDPELQYVEGWSESQLARLNGLHRIWDSGKTRYVFPG